MATGLPSTGLPSPFRPLAPHWSLRPRARALFWQTPRASLTSWPRIIVGEATSPGTSFGPSKTEGVSQEQYHSRVDEGRAHARSPLEICHLATWAAAFASQVCKQSDPYRPLARVLRRNCLLGDLRCSLWTMMPPSACTRLAAAHALPLPIDPRGVGRLPSGEPEDTRPCRQLSRVCPATPHQESCTAVVTVVSRGIPKSLFL
jgi:hypothetical protein